MGNSFIFWKPGILFNVLVFNRKYQEPEDEKNQTSKNQISDIIKSDINKSAPSERCLAGRASNIQIFAHSKAYTGYSFLLHGRCGYVGTGD